MTVRATWRDAAARRHADPELFFPAAPPGLDAQARVAAGVWGGTTENERRPAGKPPPQ
jgi:hypothetical protein